MYYINYYVHIINNVHICCHKYVCTVPLGLTSMIRTILMGQAKSHVFPTHINTRLCRSLHNHYKRTRR